MAAHMKTRRILTFVLVAPVVLYLSMMCLLYLNQSSMIYPGTRNRVQPVAPGTEGADLLKIPTADGNVDAIFLPAMDDTAARRPVAIFAHGNGEVIDYWLTGLQSFRDRGIGVLLVEYPGYGRSAGSPSEASIRAAMSAAYDRIAADPRVDRARIFGFGQSLGGAAICALARDRPLRALILESAFPSLDIFADGYWAPRFLLRDHFDNVSSVRHFPGRVLVIHGKEDQLVPWQLVRVFASASPRVTFKLYDCGHGCWDPDHLPFWQDAMPFLRETGIL
jgi:pimeloyl-ACP methyl ester carboxylesterase